MKFTAYDIINKKPINLYKIILSSCGGIIAFQDLNGEQYGPHQIHLTVNISDLTNETVQTAPLNSYYAYGDGWIRGKDWEKGGGSRLEDVSIKEHGKVNKAPEKESGKEEIKS